MFVCMQFVSARCLLSTRFARSSFSSVSLLGTVLSHRISCSLWKAKSTSIAVLVFLLKLLKFNFKFIFDSDVNASCVMSESEYLLLIQEDIVPPSFFDRSVSMRCSNMALTTQIPSEESIIQSQWWQINLPHITTPLLVSLPCHSCQCSTWESPFLMSIQVFRHRLS